jgi:hypothetical protein
VTVATIPGWIEQWYGKLPAEGKVILNVPPGAIVPDVHAPVFEMEVCAVESLFVHVTVPPTLTVTGFGEYAVVVNVDDPDTIDTDVPDGVAGDVDGDEEPHAVKRLNPQMMSARREVISPPAVSPTAKSLPAIADAIAPPD